MRFLVDKFAYNTVNLLWWKILADKGRSCVHHYGIASTADGLPDCDPLSALILYY